MQCHAMLSSSPSSAKFCATADYSTWSWCSAGGSIVLQCTAGPVKWGGIIYCTLAGSTTEAIRYNEGHLIEGSVLLHFTSHWKHSIERQCILHCFGPFLILLPKVLKYLSYIKHPVVPIAMSLRYLARENTMKIQCLSNIWLGKTQWKYKLQRLSCGQINILYQLSCTTPSFTHHILHMAAPWLSDNWVDV